MGALGLLVACGADKDHADRNREAANLGYPAPNSCPCVRNCLPDPGSRAVDCAAAEAGLEFMQIYAYGLGPSRIYDFENRQPDGTEPRPAPNLYMYTDYTSRFLVPFEFEPGTVVLPDGSKVGAVTSEEYPQADRCHTGHNTAFHVQGGPFTNWGGGMGISLMKIFADNCALQPVGERPEYCPPQGVEFATETLDLSRWEGISLWARRGPEGQAALRVMLGDKYTDDDLSYMHYNYAGGSHCLGAPCKPAEPSPTEPEHPHPLYCERVKKCSCEDFARDCTLYTGQTGYSDNQPLEVHFCWDPTRDDPRPSYRWKMDSCQQQHRTLLCGDDMCDADYPAFADGQFGDEPFKGRPCTRFQFIGGDAGNYCFQPGVDPNPAEGFLRCGDHWYYPISLTTDWQFYLIPFTDLHQEGWAKISDHLDLTAASILRFTWTTGWIDYWIDDVSFYRHSAP